MYCELMSKLYNITTVSLSAGLFKMTGGIVENEYPCNW